MTSPSVRGCFCSLQQGAFHDYRHFFWCASVAPGQRAQRWHLTELPAPHLQWQPWICSVVVNLQVKREPSSWCQKSQCQCHKHLALVIVGTSISRRDGHRLNLSLLCYKSEEWALEAAESCRLSPSVAIKVQVAQMMQKLSIMKDFINLQQLLHALIATSMGRVPLSNKDCCVFLLSHLI